MRAEVGDEPTTTRTKYACQVTYGDGGIVQQLVTAFESSTALLYNIPPSMTHSRLIALAEPYGPLKCALLIPARDAQSKPSARIEYLKALDAARAVADIVHQVGLRGATARLDLRAAENGKAILRSTKVKLSLFSPSLTAWAHYFSIWQAKQHAARMNGMSFDGHTIRATFQAPTPNQTTSFSVELKGLPIEVSSAHIQMFSYAESVTLGNPSFTVEDAIDELRELLSRFGTLEAIDFVPHVPKKPKLFAFVQFTDPDAAEAAVRTLHKSRQPFLRGSQLFLEAIHSIKYILPYQQFDVMRFDFDELREMLQTCKLRYHDKDANGQDVEKVYVRAYGPDAKALGRLKVELEALLEGDLILDSDGQALWHEHLSTAAGARSLESIGSQTGTYVKCDARLRKLQLFGSQYGRVAANSRILTMVHELRDHEHIVELDQSTFRRMVHGGYQQIRVAVGDKVALDVVQRQLKVSGDDTDVRLVRDMIIRQSERFEQPVQESSDSISTCPVCFCNATDPLLLPCGHSYCRSCLHHYLNSLGQSSGAARIAATCIAETIRDDDATQPCSLGIPLQFIRLLLSPGEEDRLLDSVFLSYIHGRPQEFHYCPTADCQTVYRASEAGSALRCPTCSVRICATCHVEFHEGLTCAEFKDNATGGNEALQRWKQEHGVKSCPGCSADLEKNGGCNHIKCARCGTHMCWVCMKTFTDTDSGGGVYAHMRREHGKIYDI